MSVSKRKKSSSNKLLDTLRVVPRQYKVEKSLQADRLTDLLAMLFVFGVAVFIRYYVRDVFINSYGDSIFNLVLTDDDTLGIGAYTGLAAGDQVDLEGYSDFSYYYIDYVNNLLDGWNPYSGSRVEGDHIGGYVYGPLYIYSIAFGSYFFGLSAYDSIVVSNVVFDSLSYVMVYLLAKRVSGNVIALFVAVLGSFSPIALFYAGIRGLNAPLMTFLALVSVYYFLERKDNRGLFFLAASTMTKQFPLLMAFPMGLWMMRRYGIFRGIGFIFMYIFDMLILSIPWIVFDPYSYVYRLFLAGGGKNQLTCPRNGEATNLVHGGLMDVCVGNEGTIPTNPSAFSEMIFTLVNSHVLFALSILVLGWIAFTAYDYFEKDHKYYYKFFAAFYTITHATIARGIFKYYLTMLIPFIILAFTPGNPDKSLNIRIGAMINQYFTRLLDPEYRIRKPTVTYWTMFILSIFSIISVFWVIDATITLFLAHNNYHNLFLLVFFIIALYSIYRPGPLNIRTTTNRVPYSDVIDKLPILIIIFALLFNYVIKIAELYFTYNVSLKNNLYIMIAIVLLFSFLNQVEKVAIKTDTTFRFYTVNYHQLVLDVIGLTVAFIAINIFTIQILIVHRLLTTTVVFIMGIILMGMLGSEIWSVGFKVIKNAILRYNRINSNNLT